MRSRVDWRTLPGSLKYFEIVGREIPLNVANSSMFLTLASPISSSRPLHAAEGGIDCPGADRAAVFLSRVN